MNIVITGAKGQLGRDCATVLAAGNRVVGYGSRELDIGDREQVFSLIGTIRPEVIINCAAYTAVDACETNRDICDRVNSDGPGILAAACARFNTRLIHISTDYVFDGNRKVPQPYLESDPVNPLSRYGVSKLAGEEKVRQQTDNHLIIRTAWLYGMGGKNFLKTMLRLALTDPARTIRVVNDQFGSLTWTYRLARPEQFTFRPGQWCFLNLPDIGFQDERGLRRHLSLASAPLRCSLSEWFLVSAYDVTGA